MSTRKEWPAGAYVAPPPSPSDDTTLNVALYPFVPVPEAFTVAVTAQWQQVQPDIALNFCVYSPYDGPPPNTIDVFAFDCIFTDDMLAKGCVDPIAASEVEDLEDFQPFALAAAAKDAQSFAGIPYLGCTNVLYYRTSDTQLGAANLSLAQLYTLLGDAQYPGYDPPPGRGLLMDLGGKTTDACLYAQVWREGTQTFWPQAFPTTPGQFNPTWEAQLALYAKMTGRAGALYQDDCGHDRTDWFAMGAGRALVGLTETMHWWDPDELELLAFRPLPVATGGNPTRLQCYADAMGIRPGLGDKRALAVQLANVVASSVVLVSALWPSTTGQYLIPARLSTLYALAMYVEKYEAIREMLETCNPVAFRLGTGVWDWAKPTGAALIAALFPGAEVEVEEVPVRRRRRYHTTPAGMWRREL